MNPRKTYQADLDRNRFKYFLIGLLISSVVIFVVAIFPFSTLAMLSEDDTMDYAAFEAQMMSAILIQKPVMMASKTPPAIEKIKIIKDTKDEPKKVNQEIEKATSKNHSNQSAFKVVDGQLQATIKKAAMFPGGEEAMQAFIQKHLRYPTKAQEKGIQGTVIISFIVQVDGTLTDFKVQNGIGGGCDEQALRVVKKMHKWEPGVQQHVARTQIVFLPIAFYFTTGKR